MCIKFMRTTISGLVVLGAIILVMQCPALAADHRTGAAQPNIVLFLVDDMGWLDSSAYGSEYYQTPNMERLRRQSMKFTNAYAIPLCSPTRASILSGQYSSRHGVTSASGHQAVLAGQASRYPAKGAVHQKYIYAVSKRFLDPELKTMAKVLRSAGYRTGHFGKWHLGLSRQHWPEKHGFEVAFHAQPSPGPRSYFSPYGVHQDGEPGPKRHVGTITDGPVGEYMTDRLTDEAIAFIESHQNEPFFLNFWHYAVHGPWGHKETYTREFSKKRDPRGQQKNPIMASMLKSVDDSLGRVMDKLDQLKLTENTIFIFYSDNGGNTHSNVPGSRGMDVKQGHPKWEFAQNWRKWAGDQPPTNNAPLREGKGRIYEGGQRVPLMIRWGGQIEANSTSDAIVGPIDFFPTLLEAAEIKKPEGHILDGVSIMPVLQQTGELDREAYFTWFPHLIPAVSVRAGQWKLIRRFEPHPKYPEVLELYHLEKDIGETRNLAREKPDKVNQLNGLIDQFVEQTGALYPKPNPNFNSKIVGIMGDQKSQTVRGLVPRNCKILRIGEKIRIVGDGRQTFLGTGQVRMNGALTLSLRVRSSEGGTGKVQWRTTGQEAFPKSTQVVSYRLPGGDQWSDVAIRLPIQGRSEVIRLYFPLDQSPIELQSIVFQDKAGKQKSWEFSNPALPPEDKHAPSKKGNQ